MATVGNTGTPSPNSLGKGWNVGNEVAGGFTMPGNGLITAIHCYAASFAGSCPCYLVIWDANTGNVLAQVAPGSNITTSAGWITASLASSLYVASGAGIYIGWANQDNTSSNSGFTVIYSTGGQTIKWNLQGSPPGNLLGGTNPTQFAGNIGAYADYTPVSAPTITSITPAHGIPGDAVTISGSGFTSVTQVGFNPSDFVSFTIVNDNTITCQVPAGAISGTVTVFNPAGSATYFFNVSTLYIYSGTALQAVDLFSYDGTHLQLSTLEAFGTSLSEIS